MTYLLTFGPLKIVSFGCFEGLGLCSNDFYSEKLQIAYMKAEQIPENIFLIFRRSGSRPAGDFWEDKMYFEPAKRPAGAFLVDKIVF